MNQVLNYRKYQTFRVFGDKALLPDRLNRTDLQCNDPFVMVSMMGCVFTPDLSEQYFDYGHADETLLQLRKDDLQKYFVPVNVTTVYKGNTFEWRSVNDQIVFHGGTYKMEQKLKGNLMGADRITLQTLLNVYNQFLREYFTKVEK